MSSLVDAVRDIGRRPLRGALTVAGIAIGVTALVAVGALSERLTRLVAGGRDFATGQITVSGAGTSAATGMMGGSLLSGDEIAKLASVPGIAKTAPIVMFPVTDARSVLPFTLPPLVFGCDVEALLLNRRITPPEVRSGRAHPAADGTEVVLGSQVARYFGVDAGQTVEIRGQRFIVAGVLGPTLSGPDSFAFMPYATAQSLLVRSEPTLRKLISVPGARILPIATAAAVFWSDGEDPEVVSARIRRELGHVSVVSPADAAAQLDRALVVVNAVILGTSVVALLVAAVAVINTMFTAVVERRREIGLRRVVGATRGQVLVALIGESVLLGLAGSAVGVACGIVGVRTLNNLTEHLGGAIFLITSRLLTVAIVLPVALAGLAGIVPAWRASRIPPTVATRYD